MNPKGIFIKSTATLFLLLGLWMTAFAQSEVVSGRVFDQYGLPLPKVLVCQFMFFNCVETDADGKFQLILNEQVERRLMLMRQGYQTVNLLLESDKSDSLMLVMLKEENYGAIAESENGGGDPMNSEEMMPAIGFYLSIGVESVPCRFTQFTPILESYNVDFMNQSDAVLSLEMGVEYKKIFSGFQLGFGSYDNTDHDSLDINFNTTLYGLRLGYGVIDSKRILLEPTISFKINHFRLINADNRRSIPIETNMQQRNLDMRINQATMDVGYRLAYKIYGKSGSSTSYYTVGIYAGFAVKLSDKPWVYSLRNKLITDKRIDLEPLTWGFTFSSVLK